jgi:hypothetical protein
MLSSIAGFGGEEGQLHQHKPCHDAVEFRGLLPPCSEDSLDYLARMILIPTGNLPLELRLLKQEPAVVMCDIKECCASERGWRRVRGSWDPLRGKARRVGEQSGNWYVRALCYA